MAFRPSDVRRVQAAFDAGLDAPYEAQIQLENMRKTMRVVIMDPDDEQLPVAQAVWWFDPDALKGVKQPRDEEIAGIVASHKRICEDYPARKAADAVEKAERDAREAANLAARQADAEARAAAEEAASLMGPESAENEA